MVSSTRRIPPVLSQIATYPLIIMKMLVLKMRIFQSCLAEPWYCWGGKCSQWNALLQCHKVDGFPLEAGGTWDPVLDFPALWGGRLSLKRYWLKSRACFSRLSCTGSVSKMRFTEWRDQRAAVMGSNQQLTGKGSVFNGKLYILKLDILWCYTLLCNKT